MTPTPIPTRSGVRPATSWFLRPPAVLSVVTVVAAAGAPWWGWWSLSVLLALVVLVAVFAGAALLGASPLTPLRERSHLILRLSWLGRYGTAAALLVLSTFLGALAGTSVSVEGDLPATGPMLVSLVGEFTRYAVVGGVSVFALWLVIDLHRLGPAGRRAGTERTLRWIGRPFLDKWVHHPAVTRWVDSLTNPVAGSLAILGGAATFLWAVALARP